jgi:hypothetical protein
MPSRKRLESEAVAPVSAEAEGAGVFDMMFQNASPTLWSGAQGLRTHMGRILRLWKHKVPTLHLLLQIQPKDAVYSIKVVDRNRNSTLSNENPFARDTLSRRPSLALLTQRALLGRFPKQDPLPEG